MDEKEIERTLCSRLRGAVGAPSLLAAFSLANSTSDATTLVDLIGNTRYEILEDNSDWNTSPHFMVDIAGGMTPDVVLRSTLSGENRIYIEVKKTRPLGYGKFDSQAIRYLLHLLATTQQRPHGIATDIRRAIVLAAPPSWFGVKDNRDAWHYFLQTYAALAATFDVTLAELHV